MSKKKTFEEFISEANSIYGGKYKYLEYVDAKTKIPIICPIHGVFKKSPTKHLKGQGCPVCADLLRKENRKHIDINKFIADAISIHGDLYDYSLAEKVKIKNNHTKVPIVCKKHGIFEQDYAHHIGRKQGCAECSGNLKSSNKIFEEKSNIIHNGKYSYKDVKYDGTHKKVLITCPIHGDFEQTPHDHLEGKGCPECAKKISKAENEIYDFLKEKLYDVSKRNREILSGKELDIFVPSKNVGIEYNGVIWHSEKFKKNRYYHLNKLEKCNSKGVKLIQIFEDEYLLKKELVKNKLLRILGMSENTTKISARKCNIIEISKESSKKFLERNHIQGFVNSSVYLGCFYNDALIGVMTFTEESKGKWNLTRFATDNNFICRGAGGKLFSYFIKHFNPIEVKSFADRRWTTNKDNNLYTKLGFILDKVLKPDYKYVKDKERVHKFNFRKQRLHKKYGFPLSMTESEMAKKLGYYRIWDCGLFKYVWKKNAT